MIFAGYTGSKKSVQNRLKIQLVELVFFSEIKYRSTGLVPSITDGVHRNENLVEIIPVFSTFSKKKKEIIKAILCNFSMQLLKYF